MIWFSGYNFHDFYHERKNKCISYDVWLFVIYCTKRNLKTSFIFFNTFGLNILWLKYDWKKCRHLSSGSQRLVSNVLLFWGLYLSTLRWDLHHHCFYLLVWLSKPYTWSKRSVALPFGWGGAVHAVVCLCFHY